MPSTKTVPLDACRSGTLMLALPLKLTLFIVRAVASVVAVAALPVMFEEIVAGNALSDTLPAVAIVASLVSTMAAVALMLALSIMPAVMVAAMEAPLERLELTLPVTSPVRAKVRTLERLVAVAALPVVL